jgi:phosphatidylinositol-3-phosphatase
MSEAPVSWKVYAENYLNAGGTINAGDAARGTHYYKRHNAAPWYAHVISNVLGSQGQIVDFEQFGIDVANGTLPRYSIIVPDGTYDRHDGTLAQADSFLQNNIGTLLSSYDFQTGGSGLLLITFDSGNGDAQGQVYTSLIGPNVKVGYDSSVFYQHQNSLRTMLDSLGIHTYPGGSNGAADMSDFFTSTSGGVAIDSPPNNSNQGTNVLVKADCRFAMHSR